jgi:hypothetical protein
VRRKGFARKLEWVCYGTVRWVDVRLTNTGLAKYPHCTQDAHIRFSSEIAYCS